MDVAEVDSVPILQAKEPTDGSPPDETNFLTNEPSSTSSSTTREEKQNDSGASPTKTQPSSSSALNIVQLKDRKHKRKLMIKTLEKKLKVLDRHIKKCSEAELTMDEMISGSSAYMKEDLYKRKFVAIWQELCDLLHIPDEIEVAEFSGSSPYSGTPFPEINRRVQRLLKLDEFPDHFDIVELIERCDSKYDLGISAEEKSQLSRKIFQEVGKLLKDRRQRDFVSHFGSHLTDMTKLGEDPALTDASLLGLLKENSKGGAAKMESICESFVTKQEQENDRSKSPEEDSSNTDQDDEGEEEVSEQDMLEQEALSQVVDVEVSDQCSDGEDQLDKIDEEEIQVDEGVGAETNGASAEENNVDIDDVCPPSSKKHKLEQTGEALSSECTSESARSPSMSPPLTVSDSTAQVTIDKPEDDKYDTPQPSSKEYSSSPPFIQTPDDHDVICLSDDSGDDDLICIIDSQ